MRRSWAFAICGVALGLSGCTMMPKYSRPAAPVPPSFPAVPTAQAMPAGSAAADLRWQEFFTDASQKAVIEQALANNRDLRVATLNVEKVRALYRIQRAELYPTIGVQANGQRQLAAAKEGEEKGQTTTQYSVAAGASAWELDLFGRVRSLKAAALQRYFASEQAQRSAQAALVAAVAQTYLALAADGDDLRLSQETLAAQQSSLKLIQRSRDLGVASDLDLHQVETAVEAARVDAARFTGLTTVDKNTLELLVGAPVDPALLPDRLASVLTPRAVSAGLSSDVLLSRPDVLVAEHQLRAANANIGAARAAFFPRIALTAGVGTVSDDLSGLFGAGTGTWTFAPQITAPIFAGGSLIANLKVSKLERKIAVAQYEKAIQQAFGEVANALTLRTTLLDQRHAQESLVRALEETYRLSDARYKAGIDGYLGVLVAQRALIGAQQALVGVRLAEQANLVTLYKVLGGGV